jgi:hypothetical protein
MTGTAHPAIRIAWALAAASALAGAARGEEVPVCFNYACARVVLVHYGDAELAPVARLLADAANPAAERSALSEAVGRLYAIAAGRTPIFRDRGENFEDDEANDGRMDCIDHSTNTSSFLHLLEGRGLLRHHRVAPRARRDAWMVQEHWAGRIAERASGAEYAVDTWFLPPGRPALVQELAEWMRGRRPAPR